MNSYKYNIYNYIRTFFLSCTISFRNCKNTIYIKKINTNHPCANIDVRFVRINNQRCGYYLAVSYVITQLKLSLYPNICIRVTTGGM